MQSDDTEQCIHNDQFHYRVDKRDGASDEFVILLHGSGGNEDTLIDFARSIWPHATLIGVRGRVVQNGEVRWFKKITPTKFDQVDAIKEADAFAKFLPDLFSHIGCNGSNVTFLGYSNGANLLAILLLKYPHLIMRAILLRSMMVLDNVPQNNLSHTHVLLVSGEKDSLYSGFAPTLSDCLKSNGAGIKHCIVNTDHMIGAEDIKVVRQWLGTKGLSTKGLSTEGLDTQGLDT